MGTFLLAACAETPPGAERLVLHSADPVFIDEILDPARAGRAPGHDVDGWLLLPETGRPPYPAVVLLHSSFGLDRQTWYYADAFTSHGLAVFAVDSFEPRGVSRTSEDHTLVTEAAMIADAYAALDRLDRDPRIDGRRVAVVGFSKGGVAALYGALERLRRPLARNGTRFAAHVAYYPWCGLRLRTPRTTGAPILIHAGGRDVVTPASLCRRVVADIRAADPGARVQMVEHAEARHGFDHPLLIALPWIPMAVKIPSHCVIAEVAPGTFVEQTSHLRVDGTSLKAAIDACAGDNGNAGGDADARDAALGQTMRLLDRVLRP